MQSLECLKLDSLQVFQEIEGYGAYEQRRRHKVDKQMAGGAQQNLEEGVARKVA